MPKDTLAFAPLTIQVETGAQVDKAKVVVRSINDGERVFVPQQINTNFLFAGEPMSSLVIYNRAASANTFMVSGFGDDIVETAAENIGDGDFVAISTTEPNACTTLTLADCRANSGFLDERSFSISFEDDTILNIITLVVNGNGGTAVASDFTLHLQQNGIDVVGSSTQAAAAPGNSYSLSAGTYKIIQQGNSSYSQSFSGNCDENGNVILTAGENKICTVIHTDIPPPSEVSTQSGGLVVPLIGIQNAPSPTSLAESGKITYEYTVWNVGGISLPTIL